MRHLHSLRVLLGLKYSQEQKNCVHVRAGFQREQILHQVWPKENNSQNLQKDHKITPGMTHWDLTSRCNTHYHCPGRSCSAVSQRSNYLLIFVQLAPQQNYSQNKQSVPEIREFENPVQKGFFAPHCSQLHFQRQCSSTEQHNFEFRIRSSQKKN